MSSITVQAQTHLANPMSVPSFLKLTFAFRLQRPSPDLHGLSNHPRTIENFKGGGSEEVGKQCILSWVLRSHQGQSRAMSKGNKTKPRLHSHTLFQKFAYNDGMRRRRIA